MNTWNRGFWHIPASYCTIFASRVAVPVPCPCMNPCRTSCRVMVDRMRLFMIEVKNFHITSTNLIPLKHPHPFVSSTIVVQVRASASQTIPHDINRWVFIKSTEPFYYNYMEVIWTRGSYQCNIIWLNWDWLGVEIVFDH